MKKHTPVYNLTVRYSTSSGDWKTLELSAPFTRWFDADGYFVAKPFQQWLASEVPAIGQADPPNAIKAREEVSATISGLKDDAVIAGHSLPSSAKRSAGGNVTPGAKYKASKKNT